MARTQSTPTARDPEVQFLGEQPAGSTQVSDKRSGLRTPSERMKRTGYDSFVSLNETEHNTKDLKTDDHESDGDWDAQKSGKDKSTKRGVRSIKLKLSEDVLWGKIWMRDEKIHKLEEANKKKLTCIAKLRHEDLEKSKSQSKDRKTKLMVLTDDLKERDKEIKWLKEELLNANKKVSDGEIKLDELINERVELLSKGDIPAQPDDIVKADLVNLFKRVKKWADTWSFEDWSGFSEEKAAAVAESLQQEFLKKFASPQVSTAISKGTIPPYIVVNALVNSVLCHETFLRPLDILKLPDTSIVGSGSLDRLQWASNLLQKQTPALKFRLRALCLRSLKPPTGNGGGRLSQDQESHVNKLLETHSQRVITRIVDLATPLLVGDHDKAPSGMEQLGAIVKDFIAVFVDLSSQNPDMKTRFRTGLIDHTFTTGHDHLVPHRALKLKQEVHDKYGESAADAGIEGRKADLVVEPAVVRAGEADGTDYHKRRLLLPAVIWMVRPADLQTPSIVGSALNSKVELSRDQPDEHSDAPKPTKEPTLLAKTISSLEASIMKPEAKKERPAGFEVVIPVCKELEAARSEARMEQTSNQKPALSEKTNLSSHPQHHLFKDNSTCIDSGTEAFESPRKAVRPSSAVSEAASQGKKRHHDTPNQPSKKQRSCFPSTAYASPVLPQTTDQDVAYQVQSASNFVGPVLPELESPTPLLADEIKDAKEKRRRQLLIPGTSIITDQEHGTTTHAQSIPPVGVAAEKPTVQIKKEPDLDSPPHIKQERISPGPEITNGANSISEPADIQHAKAIRSYLRGDYYDERLD